MMDPGLPRWKWLMYLMLELTMSRRTQRIIAVSPEEQRALEESSQRTAGELIDRLSRRTDAPTQER